MSRTWLLIGASLALGLAAAITACEKSPAAPTPPPGGGSSTPTATRLEITGPRAIVPGVPTQFTATVHLSDGSSRDVTTSASWRSPWDAFVVSAPGLVTARWNGSVLLSAAYAGLTSTREVIAVPEGTFRLTGTVTDVTAPAGPVSGALVEVKDGIGRGLSTRTGNGFYVLHGVAGDIELRVTKEGYRTLDQRLVVTDHQALNLDLPLAAPLPDVTGSWVLTITAADTCSTALPEDAMSRKYSSSRWEPTSGLISAGRASRRSTAGLPTSSMTPGLAPRSRQTASGSTWAGSAALATLAAVGVPGIR